MLRYFIYFDVNCKTQRKMFFKVNYLNFFVQNSMNLNIIYIMPTPLLKHPHAVSTSNQGVALLKNTI